MIRFVPSSSSPPVLAIDTCASKPGAAVYVGEAVAAARYLEQERARGEAMAALVEGLLNDAAVAPADLAGLGVVNGPGSYTGLRVGLALVRGLALVDRLPVAAIGSLELAAICAAREIEDDAVLTVVLDAGRGNAFDATYRKRGDSIEELSAPCTRSYADLERHYRSDRAREPLAVEAATPWLLATEAGAEPTPSAAGRLTPVSFAAQRAGELARAAAAQLERGRGRDSAAVLPLYVGSATFRRDRGKVVPMDRDEK